MPKQVDFEKHQPPLCKSCQHLLILSGDWVPYGSTNVQLPDTWDCDAEWEDGDLEDQMGNDIIEQLFLGKELSCPHYLELPHCEKHPDQYIDKKYGCGECESELWAQEAN